MDPSLITHLAPKSPVAEAYRATRTNIEFSGVDREIRTLLVTSTTKAEGKSTTIGNLAITFAQLGRRVLLVDTDLRRPRLHRLFGVDNRFGLTNALLARGRYQEYVKACEVKNLSVLAAGPIPPNPTEMLMSHAMQQFLEQVRQEYDHILLDSPPVAVVTDAAILATKVDGVILVVQSGRVDRKLLQRTRDLLAQVKANVLGVILNGITPDHEEYYSQYYYSYYADGEPQKGSRRSRARRRRKKAAVRTPDVRAARIRPAGSGRNPGGLASEED